MAPPKKESNREGAEARVRAIIEGILTDRDKKSARAGENKEQQWLRQVIGEELDARFEAFAAGLLDEGDEGGKGRKPGADPDEGGEGGEGGDFSILRLLAGGKS